MRKKAPNGWIKISEFERLTSVSAKTITAAINRGAIPSEHVARIGTTATAPYFLNPKKSAVAWYNSLNANHPHSRKLKESLAPYIRTFDKATIGESKSKRPSDIVSTLLESDAASILLDPNIGNTMTMAEAQRKEKVAKAMIAELELQEKQGTLVQKSLIDSELFAVAQEIRNALLAIPDRIVDQVIANSTNRNKAHNTIYEAIAVELEKLSDINNRLER